MTKKVTLEEKLNAQIKNVLAIVNDDIPAEIKTFLLKQQREYLNYLLEEIELSFKIRR